MVALKALAKEGLHAALRRRRERARITGNVAIIGGITRDKAAHKRRERQHRVMPRHGVTLVGEGCGKTRTVVGIGGKARKDFVLMAGCAQLQWSVPGWPM